MRSSTTVKYKDDSYAVSMSGGCDVRTSGLVLSLRRVTFKDTDKYTLDVQVLNSKGLPSSCVVEFPNHVEDLDRIIDILGKFRDCIASGSAPEDVEL